MEKIFIVVRTETGIEFDSKTNVCAFELESDANDCENKLNKESKHHWEYFDVEELDFTQAIKSKTE